MAPRIRANLLLRWRAGSGIWDRPEYQPNHYMASRNSNTSAPLTFDLPLSLIAKIQACRRSLGLKSASEVIRLALEKYDFEAYRPNPDPHRQISVRVSSRQRSTLKRFARTKHASVGELLRLALENLPSKAGAKKARA